MLSGVNNGQNLGDIVNCSGTAAGAREGALQGALGIAMSQGVDYERGAATDWAVARQFAKRVVEGIRREAGPQSRRLVQRQFPVLPPRRGQGHPRRPHAALRPLADAIFPVRQRRKVLHRHSGDADADCDPDHDFHLLMHGRAITVTPVSLQASDQQLASRMDGRLSLPVM